MTETNEFDKKDLKIANDLETSIDENEVQITFWFETWFDADKKFGTHINDTKEAWLDMYARYTPETDSFEMFWGIDRPWDPIEWNEYIPTKAEKNLIVSMLSDKIRELYNCSLSDFCKWMEE